MAFLVSFKSFLRGSVTAEDTLLEQVGQGTGEHARDSHAGQRARGPGKAAEDGSGNRRSRRGGDGRKLILQSFCFDH
jgi:hypothetical protein